MGDFNAKVGSIQDLSEKGIIGKHAYGPRNENGEQLVDFALGNELKIMNTTFPTHPRRLYTWTEPDGETKHQLDYISIQKDHSELIRGTRTMPGADCGSDHELLIADMKWKLRSKKKQIPIPRYDVETICGEFSVAVKNRFSELCKICEEHEPEELANSIKVVFKEEAKKHLKKKKKKKQPWISDETLIMIEERKRLKKRKQVEPEKTLYREVNKEVKLLCKRDRKAFLEVKCKKIENLMSENKSREMYKEIKDLTSTPGSRLNAIKDAEGKTLTEDKDIANRWVEYCSKMYTADDNEDTQEDLTTTTPDSCPPPLRAEVEKAIRALKKHKSPGCDEICGEMILAGGEEAIDIYFILIKKIWTSEKWPLDWKKSIYVPLPKKGDLQLCSNYRTIALISHASKILLNIILKRLSTKIEEEISNTQAGYMKNRGTRDHLFNLTTLLQKHNDHNIDLRICFIDYSKAFDCVSHKKMWKTLKDMNFDSKLILLLKSLYNEQKAVVRLENSNSEPFDVGKGVRQGCILSPHLFSLYTEDIMRNVSNDDRSNSYDEVKINGQKLRDLRYADDTALLSTTDSGLKNLVEATKEHSEDKYLMLNIKKTKIMDTDKCLSKTAITIGEDTIENVEHFEYLGASFYGDGRSKNEIRRRIAIAKQKLNNMKRLWKGQSIETKMRVLQSCIFPVAIYGCEAWTPLQADIKRLIAFEMTCYRKLLQISWTQKITNEEVRARLNVTSSHLFRHYKKQKLSYFGHIKRHSTLEKTILEGRIEGRRKRGRPRRRWVDDIQEWLQMSVVKAGELAQNRDVYRGSVRAATRQGTAFNADCAG